MKSKEYSQVFLDGMKSRMLTSYYKYGALEENAERCQSLNECRKRITKYRRTGNTEWLLDAANFLMIEFMFPKHPRAHFRATESSESPGVGHLTVAELRCFKDQDYA